MNTTKLSAARSVRGNAEGLVSRGGLVWLAETADLCGLTAGFDAAFASLPQRVHRPGRTMAQMVLALADGATAVSDIAVLRNQPAIAGRVPSGATVWRTFDAVGSVELRGIAAARAAARKRAWAAGAAPKGSCWLSTSTRRSCGPEQISRTRRRRTREPMGITPCSRSLGTATRYSP